MRLFFIHLAFFCGAALGSAGQAQLAAPDTVATRVQVRGVDCALFPAAARWPRWHQPVQPRRFTPSLAQAQAAEQHLATVSLLALSRKPTSPAELGYAARITQRLGQYHRQYFGFYNAQQQPCLYLSSVADIAWDQADLRTTLPPGYVLHWLREAMELADAGDNFWGIYYNVATGQFYGYWHDLDLGGG